MGANLSTPEKIAKLSRSGDSESLQALLTDLQRNDAQFSANRARYLELPDEHGNTPLTLAAARGHLNCVKLLLQFGANVQHVNRKPDGGSALHEAVAHKHEAVVELLLRHGANPFVENIKGFTAMDIACSTRNVPLLRRLEQCAPFTGWLLVKVPQFGGLGASWQRRWVVVSHRYPNPQAPAARQLTHCVFLAYKSLANTAPSARMWLDGARAREVYNPKAEARLHAAATGGPRVAQAGVTLHRKHELPSGVYTTGGHGGLGAPQEGYTFYLRPDDGSPVAVLALDKLIRVVNNRGFPVEDRPAAGAGSSAGSASGTPTSQQHATARPSLPPAGPGPLYSSLLSRPPEGGGPPGGVPAMASAPGTWGAYPPPGGGASSTPYPLPVDCTESDEQIARRLQEEYDAEVANQLQDAEGGVDAAATVQQQAVPAALAAAPPSAPPPPGALAGSGGSGGTPDYLTGGAFYPQVHYGDSGIPSGGPPPTLQQQGSGLPPHPAAASGSHPTTPAGPAADNLQTFGRPSAPALMDMDYHLSLAAGAAALAGGATRPQQAQPQQLHISSSGRHASAPRLQEEGWTSEVPAVPPTRAASESETTAAKRRPGVGTAAGAAAGLPDNETDDSSVCVFCMDAPATAGVLHGESVHRCLCRDCAVHLKESNVDACPMCREKVQAYIMRVF